MFEFTIQADSWDDLRMKVLALFPEKQNIGKMVEKAAPSFIPEKAPIVKHEVIAKKPKGWPKGKKRGKRSVIPDAPKVSGSAEQSDINAQNYLEPEKPFIEPIRTYDNPKDAYMAAIKNWQKREPWALMDGTVISDRGPNVKDFQK